MGVITPILKKSKDQMLTENYRGITITSVHGKVFEYILLEKTTIAKDGQSNMQFGFTEGFSPNMAALILSEVCSNITAKDILFIRPKKNICVFTVTCQKNLGSVGRD